MYYYILESPKNNYEKKVQQKIKLILGELGIAGETVNVSPARSSKEAVKMGLIKGYKTMVAIGSDWLANKIGGYICGRNVILGLIPIYPDQKICDLIQTKDFKNACEALKYRRIKMTNLGFIEPNRFFMTPAKIKAGAIFSMEVSWDNCKIQTKATDILISPDLDIFIRNQEDSKLSFGDVLNWLVGKNNKKADIYSTHLKASEFRITTSQILSLKIGEKIIAKTPFLLKLAPELLPVITYRDKLKSE